ncbi:ATP-binding protein [Planctomycetota bacterium]
MGNTYKNSLSISTDTGNLQMMRDFLADCIFKSGMVPQEWQNKITLAVDEAVSNIIEHGYQDEAEGIVDLHIEAALDKFSVIIFDSGKSFDPDEVEDVNIQDHVTTAKTGGLGIFIMRRIMDEISYTFKESERNELKMVKYFKE